MPEAQPTPEPFVPPSADAGRFRAELSDAAPAVHRYLLAIGGDPHRAGDAAQDVLLKAWQARDRFDGRSSLTTWLFRIARNHWIDMLRRDRSAPPPVPLPADRPAEADAGPAQALERRETARAVNAALEGLPAEQREALALRESGGLTFEQAAEVLGVPTATVKSRVRYALLKLAERLAPLTREVGS